MMELILIFNGENTLDDILKDKAEKSKLRKNT